MPDQVRHDGKGEAESFVVTNWDHALKKYQKAEAALAAAAHTDDEALYDRLGTRHERALQRLLRTPAPTVAALALKLDLALYERAEESSATPPPCGPSNKTPAASPQSAADWSHAKTRRREGSTEGGGRRR